MGQSPKSAKQSTIKTLTAKISASISSKQPAYANGNYKQLSIKDSIKYRKYYKAFVIGSGAFLIAFLISSVFSPVQNSDASTVRITNNTSDFYIEITSADDLALNVEADPNGKLAYAADTVKVVTNSDNGYKLYVSTTGNDNNIYAGGSSDNSSQGYFSPSSGSISSPAALSQNTWGFALNKSQATSISTAFANVAEYVNDTGAPTTSSTWAAVPTYANSETAKISEGSSDNSPAGASFDIYYGVNASTSLPSGDYSTTVIYTAVSEGVNVFDTMQDFTSEKCDTMSTDSSINLTDSRDGKYYRVTKMKDGHCWMTDNLALDGTDKAGNVRTLTPNDSDVTSNVTLAKNIESGTPSNATDVQIFSGVANDYTSEEEAQAYTYAVANDTKYGNLYNWFAATARSGTSALTNSDASMSICPKGWRLPSNTGDWSYGNLLKAYGAGDGANVGPGEIGGGYIQIAQKAPLYFTLAGTYVSAPYNQDHNAYYWSRTPGVSTSDNAYSLGLYSENGTFTLQNSNTKIYGFSVRCVFAGQKDEIMQNFTSTMCNNLALSTSSADNRKTMIDSRDGKFYKISRLADNPGTTGSNGTCWMVSNLALDGADPLGTVRTLAPSDSNVTQNRTLAKNIIPGTVESEYNVVQIDSNIAENVTTSCSGYQYCLPNDVKYGNLYNWTAATAGVGRKTDTGAITESVCPKGWRLPDNGTEEGVRTFANLFSKYTVNLDGTGDTLPTGNVNFGPGIKRILQAPLWFSMAGAYYTSEYYQGWAAIYWSRVASTEEGKAYSLDFNSNNGMFRLQVLTGQQAGSSVRCVTE